MVFNFTQNFLSRCVQDASQKKNQFESGLINLESTVTNKVLAVFAVDVVKAVVEECKAVLIGREA